MNVRILIGDCIERMRELPDNSVDSVVCDPPYHLTSIVKRFGSATAAPAQSKQTGVYARSSKGFMGQTWDGGDVAFRPETWAEVLRVLKPGGHLLAFSGTRTYHRMAVAIEDAGFEVRDMIAWHYGSGFPKSLDVSKAIDKSRDDKPDIHRVCAFVAAARDTAGKANREIDALFGFNGMAGHWTNSKGPQAQVPKCEQWQQLKTFLRFSDEMDAEVWRLNGRKGQPGENWKVIGEREAGAATGGVYGTFAQRVEINEPTDAAKQWEGYGTALKPATEPICLARKPLSEKSVAANVLKWGTGALNIDGCRIETNEIVEPDREGSSMGYCGGGKGAPRIVGSGTRSHQGRWPANLVHDGSDEVVAGFPDSDGQQGDVRGTEPSAVTNGIYGEFAGRVASAARNDGGSAARFFYCAKATTEERGEGNNHPTVKPIALMQWLIRLVTPKGGTVLDPFMGSGSTLIAADAEQFDAIGCELSPEYAAIAERRLRDAAGMFADVQIAA